MNGFNKVIVAGNLTRDPELQYTQSGTAIAKAAIALNRRSNREGQPRDETTFVDWTAFGDTAALLAEHCRKGQAILLEGRLHQEQWEDRQTGAKRSKLVVIVERLTFLPSPEADQPEKPNPKTKPNTQPVKHRETETDPFGPEDDDVPF